MECLTGLRKALAEDWAALVGQQQQISPLGLFVAVTGGVFCGLYAYFHRTVVVFAIFPIFVLVYCLRTKCRTVHRCFDFVRALCVPANGTDLVQESV
ncbi:MAG: hypothetical protein LBP65_00445 [Puniceicoccales bacterium]|nr:hypothetical protein [Puniceicoccales bacterium]